ncbi:hypothetical protein GCM10012280_41460 [Wenjunlia tyrosinilytica]|uniref:Uncharacterized protein n=1 Tax=Wenjunlia tyrosinilytica TaxID=1544741 RepID=A0A917ZS64_9ACTN|nr:hypothetical protein GCM10012280_41460 [Wenjunlia tyrosinilytica]
MWAATASLMGVVVGGLLSFAAQETSRRSSERTEEQRRDSEIAEKRRDNRVSHLVEFLVAAQAAERVAADRGPQPPLDEGWQVLANQSIDRLWVLQKTIHMLCAPHVNEAARGLCFALQEVIKNGPDDSGEPFAEQVAAHIRPSRRAFLDAAHEYLG